jgi:alkylation response protein AidB-like acyl-CoA dehydrogenase
MQLNLSESQLLLRDTVARLFAEESTSARVRAAESSGGFDRTLWDVVVSLGLIGMRAAASVDGGSSLFDAALATEEAGRHLASIPLVEAIVAAALLQRAGADPALIKRATTGEVATLALKPIVSGQRQLVPAGGVARLVLALDGDTLVVIERTGLAAAQATAPSPVEVVDLSAEPGARIVLALGGAARAIHAAAIEEWKLLAAALLAGMARRALELAGAYSCERVQFGRPIGSFQGVAHPLADSATEVDGAHLLVRRAIWAIAEGRRDASESVSMAWWWAGRAAERAVLRSVRAFGGYGVSLEYDVQLYFRRVRLVSLLLGDPQEHLDTIAERRFDGNAAPLPPAGDIAGIDFGYGAAAEAYAAELRRFVEANMTPEIQKTKHFSTSGHHPDFHKKLAAAGYAFPDLAADGGTPARSRYEVMAAAALWEDIGWTRVPTAVTEMVGKLALIWSQPGAKAEILPRIIAGEALGALGFSEPGSGSDVFAARFSAVRDGDGWLLNGQKMFTTNAHHADYIIMLARTSNEGRKHEGLTMFIMPLRLSGVEIQPVYTLQEERTNIVYFSDVRVSDVYRLGEVGEGAKVMASALQIEQGGSDYHFAQLAMLRRALAWANRARPDRPAPITERSARRVLARAATHSMVAEVLCRRAVWGTVEGRYEISWGPMAKLFTTESLLADATAIVDLAAPASLIRGVDEDLDVIESMMRRAIAMTLYGGTSEVHRSLIAENSLGMPRSRS